MGEIEAAEAMGEAYEEDPEDPAAADVACLAFEAILEDRACFVNDAGEDVAAESLLNRMHIDDDIAHSKTDFA